MRRRDDDGTVLVLLLGFTAVLLLMVAVVVNVSAVILAKRSLASTADAAAVAAAQALDLHALHVHGLSGGPLPLHEGEARARAASYLSRVEQSGLQVSVDVAPDGRTAVVRAVREVELPFGRVLGFAPVEVHAEARARAPMAP